MRCILKVSLILVRANCAEVSTIRRKGILKEEYLHANAGWFLVSVQRFINARAGFWCQYSVLLMHGLVSGVSTAFY